MFRRVNAVCTVVPIKGDPDLRICTQVQMRRIRSVLGTALDIALGAVLGAVLDIALGTAVGTALGTALGVQHWGTALGVQHWGTAPCAALCSALG